MWKRICSIVIFASFVQPNLSIRNPVVLENEEPVSNIPFLQYEDADLSICSNDEEGNPVVVYSDREGKAAFTPGYYYQMEPVQGFLWNDRIYQSGEEEIHIESINATIQVVNEGSQTIHLSLYDEDEWIAEMDGKDDLQIGPQLYQGHTYHLEWEEIEGYQVTVQPQYFTVEAEEIEIQVLCEEIRTIHLTTNAIGAAVTFYRDEACEQIEKEVELQEDNEITLVKKDLWVKLSQVPHSYYLLSETMKLDGNEEEMSIMLSQPAIHFEMEGDGAYQLRLYNREDEIIDTWMNEGSEHVSLVERDETYRLEALGGMNCFSLEDTSIEVGLYEKEHIVHLQTKPFAVSFSLRDEGRNEGIRYQIEVMDTQEHQSVLYEGKGTIQVDAYEGERLWYQVRWVEDGYQCSQSGSILAAPDCPLHVDLIAEGYVWTDFVIDGNASYEIFLDEECRQKASDLNGNLIEEVKQGTQLLLYDGIYYCRQKETDLQYYNDEEIHQIMISRAVSLNREVRLEQIPVLAQFGIRDANRMETLPISMEITTRDGQWVASVQPGQEIPLHQGETYVLHQESEVPGYLTANNRMFQMGTLPPSTIPVFYLDTYAYRIVHMQSKMKDGYMVYTDAQCSIPAMDLEGNPIRLFDGQFAAVWPGIYYAKQVETSQNHYPDNQVYILDCQSEDVSIMTEGGEEILFSVFLTNQENDFLDGIEMELCDETGVLYSWTTKSEAEKIPSEILKTGKTYFIRQKSGIAGYTYHRTEIAYTIPTEKPSSALQLHIINEKEKKSIRTVVSDSQPNDSIPLGLIGILIGTAGLCKMFQKMKTD